MCMKMGKLMITRTKQIMRRVIVLFTLPYELGTPEVNVK